MSKQTSNVVGENALDRTIRLLKRLNDRFADPDVPGMQRLELRILPDGEMVVENLAGSRLFSSDAEGMVDFLAASIAAQVLAIRLED